LCPLRQPGIHPPAAATAGRPEVRKRLGYYPPKDGQAERRGASFCLPECVRQMPDKARMYGTPVQV